MSESNNMTQTKANAIVHLRSQMRAQSLKANMKAAGNGLLNGVITIVMVLIVWQAIVSLTGISSYVAKGPWDVFEHLFLKDDSAEIRVEQLGMLGVTLWDSLIGFVAGMLIALVMAVLFRLSKTVEASLMPVALLLRSVPLVAIAPVIILIFGPGSVASVAVIGGIVVLFPALVNIAFGLQSASQQSLDVVTIYGGNAWTQVRKVALPSALPSLFAAIRISVPGAITGALLAEWLSTGTGVGGAINKFMAQAKYADFWTAVMLVTLVALVLYAIAEMIEKFVLSRMGMMK